MDTEKDITKGQENMPIKDREIRVYKGHIQNSLTKEDEELSFIISKTEKLTMASYMITDFLDVREPLKWELREKAIDLLSYVGTFSNNGHITRNVSHSPVLKTIKEINSLLDFLCRLSLISEMNSSILKKEYDTLYRSIESRLAKGDPVGNFLLPERFFDDEQRPDENKRHERRSLSGVVNKKPWNREAGVITDNKNAAFSDDKQPHPFPENVPQQKKNSGAGVYNPRREVIVGLLKTRGEIDIKDITGVISNCSEKTVQRELALLVGEGLVKKVGERRWSKYMLTPPLAEQAPQEQHPDVSIK